MNRQFIPSFILSLIFALAPAVVSADMPITAIHQAENIGVYVTANVTRVTTSDYDGTTTTEEVDDISICSGFMVQTKGTYELIVTARHCVISQEPGITITPYSVHFFDGDVGIVKGYGYSPDSDVAVMVVQSKHKHHFNPVVFNTHVERGQSMFTFGMPDRRYWSYSSVTSMTGDSNYNNPDAGPDSIFNRMEEIECTSCYSGNSGGPVFNSKGQIVGLLSASSGDPAMFLMTPAKDIIKILNAISK